MAMKKRVSNYKGYTFYEYLESDGGDTYINLQYKPNSNTKTDMEIYVPSTVTEGVTPHYLYACNSYKDAEGTTVYARYGIIKASSNKFRFDYSNAVTYNTDAYFTNEVWTKVSIYKGLKVGDNSYHYGELTDEFQSTCNLCLFKGCYDNVVGTTNGFSSAYRIKYCKIYDNGTLVRNLVPASKEGVYGLYDLANDVFYTNKGTGTFSVGDVAEVEVEYNSAIRGRWNKKNKAYITTNHTTSQNNLVRCNVINGSEVEDTIIGTYSSWVGHKIDVSKYSGTHTITVHINNIEGQIGYLDGSIYYSDGTHIFNIWANYNNNDKSVILDLTNATHIALNFYPYKTNGTEIPIGFTNGFKVQLEEGSTATEYVPYIQEVKEVITTAPQLPSNGDKEGTINGVDYICVGNKITAKGTKTSTYGSFPFNIPITKEGKYCVETKCLKNNGTAIVNTYIYGKLNGKANYWNMSANNTVGRIQKSFIELTKDNLADGRTDWFLYPQMTGSEGDTVDYEMEVRAIPIVSISEVKTKVNGEVKTLFEV